VDPPVITCPESVTLRGVPAGGQTVTLPAPTVAGGALPVSVVCTPPSGGFFPVGSNPVACTAVDARGRQSTCSFGVTLTPLLLDVTKFVAVGDSLTEGENGRPARLRNGFIDLPNVYPVQLQALLEAEYPGQGITVANRGHSGDPIETGVKELPDLISDERAGGLLLLDGYNNLRPECSPRDAGSATCAQRIRDVVFGIRDCIRIAKRPEYALKGVFVSTLTPPGPYLGIGIDRRIAREAIVQANSGIAQMATAEGATLVDAYSRFLGHEAEYVDQDGLHLRPAGYLALAETFFAAIKRVVSSTPAFRALLERPVQFR
jgi:lysophospholipase L1-like esterase